MPRKKPKVSLSQPIKAQTGDIEKLFASDQDVEQAAGLQLLAIRLDAILPDPLQPRNTFPEESLQELSESIRQDGVIQPIEVTQMGPDEYMIVHGERRWRAAEMAGLEMIPAIVRRRDYDEITRFVRQLVENIQREDLNDVDRAAGLIRLRELMQEELTAEQEGSDESLKPWGKKVSWAKVGERLGYSRQRINQLIKLLDLPQEIQEAVRAGTLSERDTRYLQGLTASQQRALHRAREAGDIDIDEAKKVARYLKEAPQQTVHTAIRTIRQPPPPPPESETTAASQEMPPSDTTDPPLAQTAAPAPAGTEAPSRASPLPTQEWVEGTVIPPRSGGPTAIDRLTYARNHLVRVQRHGHSKQEHAEILRLLHIIQQEVATLIEALEVDQADG